MNPYAQFVAIPAFADGALAALSRKSLRQDGIFATRRCAEPTAGAAAIVFTATAPWKNTF